MNELSEQARKLRNAYQRAYRRKHPEKLKEYNIRYWEKKAGTQRNISYEEIFDLREQGLSQRAISKKLNISLGKVNAILNKR